MMGASSSLAILADWASRACIAGGVLILAGMVLTAWALRGDRSRGRRRCPKCWYDLRGTPGLRCSECGHAARTERYLHRTRRYWRWAALAAGLQVGGIFLFAPKVQRDGMLSILPTTILLVLSPKADDAFTTTLSTSRDTAAFSDASWHPSFTDRVVDELARRRQSGQSLWSWQWRYVIERKRVVQGPRERWPVAISLPIRSRLPDWVGGARIRSWLHEIGDNKEAITAEMAERPYARPWGEVVGPIASAEGIDWRCIVLMPPSPPPANPPSAPTAWPQVGTVTLGKPLPPLTPQIAWRGSIRPPVTLVETINEAITPENDPELNDAVRAAVHLKVVLPRSCTFPCHNAPLSLMFDRSKHPRLTDIAFGMTVELLLDDRIIQTLQPERLEGAYSVGLIGFSQWLFFERAGDFPKEQGFAPWRLRVRGDGEMALYDRDRPNYWAGEFTVQLAEVLGHD